jgi:DNA-binding Xre family transcriptional regulator
MKTKNKHLTSFDTFIDDTYGPVGTKKRDEFEAGFENFKIGVLLHEARLKKGLTQEELAQKAGTTKSYISKIENNVKEVRLSTLEKIIKLGLGGSLEVSIKI